MKAPHRRIAIGFILLCLCIAGGYFATRHNPYARLERMGKSALRLSTPGVAPGISDRLVGVLHRREPRVYFSEEAQKEQERLLSAGLLVETRIPYQPTRSRDDVYKVLWRDYQKTGAYWAATVDTTNLIVTLVSKPKDVASFAAALTNE